MHQSRMWRDADGVLVASSMQDGMVRLKREDGVGKVGFSPEGSKYFISRVGVVTNG